MSTNLFASPMMEPERREGPINRSPEHRKASLRAPAGFERFQHTRSFGSLDALRAIGILLVIYQHAPAVPLASAIFTNSGATGVALFFTLSGFLITTLLLREQSRFGQISLRDFYVRRTLRIFPLYYAVLALYTFLVLVLEQNAAGRLFMSNLPFYATYTSNWFVDMAINEEGQRRVIFVFAWTLATEEQFYLAWPALMRYLRRGIAVAILLGVMILDLAMTFTVGPSQAPASWMERAIRIACSPSTEIAMGVLGALALHQRRPFAFLWRVLGQRWSAPAAAVIAVGAALWPWGDTPAWFLLQSCALAALVLACVIREDHGLAWVLRVPLLARIGVVSYGMYLLHMLAYNTVTAGFRRADLESGLLAFALTLSLTYLAAEVSYRLFESQFLRLRDRFRTGGTVKC